jgi:RHS repeat-associated protein
VPTTTGFLGKHEDGSGLTHLEHRDYDPTTGVFITVDALVAATGDPYNYTAGNPTTFADPTGLCWKNNGRQGADDGKGPCGIGVRATTIPSGESLPKRNHFDVEMDDYRTVEEIAGIVDIDPLVLLIVYDKEYDGWWGDQQNPIRDLCDTFGSFGGDCGDSMGVTNIQFGTFEATVHAHSNELAPFLSAMNNERRDADDLWEFWQDLENGSPADRRASLAVTGFVLKDLAAELGTIDPSSLDGVPGVTPYEWSIQAYRYSLNDTVLPLARGDKPLGPKVSAEIEYFRAEYGRLEERYGVQ